MNTALIISLTIVWFLGALFLFFLLGWKQQTDKEKAPTFVHFQIIIWPIFLVVLFVINVIRAPFIMSMRFGEWLYRKISPSVKKER